LQEEKHKQELQEAQHLADDMGHILEAHRAHPRRWESSSPAHSLESMVCSSDVERDGNASPSRLREIRQGPSPLSPRPPTADSVSIGWQITENVSEAEQFVEMGTEDLEATVAMRDAMNKRRCYLLVLCVLCLAGSGGMFYLFSQHSDTTMYFYIGLILMGVSILAGYCVYCFR